MPFERGGADKTVHEVSAEALVEARPHTDRVVLVDMDPQPSLEQWASPPSKYDPVVIDTPWTGPRVPGPSQD